MTTGILTGIQRFSLNDGPGIRTTVFFQGCNMHCVWCHNPETIPMKPKLMFYPLKCVGCGACIHVCPTGAQTLCGGEHKIDRSKCVSCGKCVENCFSSALVMSGRAYTVDEVLSEVLQDREYYVQSGGGVTFSGGECTLQSGFLIELAKACRANGIAAALETNIDLPFEKLQPIFSEMDLIMFDLKLADSAAHETWTGMKNERVKENILQTNRLGIPMIARTPLIPGATDTVENIQAIIDFLAPLEHVTLYELLNFNPLGGSKMDALGEENPFACTKPLKKDALNELTEALTIPDGFTVRIR